MFTILFLFLILFIRPKRGSIAEKESAAGIVALGLREKKITGKDIDIKKQKLFETKLSELTVAMEDISESFDIIVFNDDAGGNPIKDGCPDPKARLIIWFKFYPTQFCDIQKWLVSCDAALRHIITQN